MSHLRLLWVLPAIVLIVGCGSGNRNAVPRDLVAQSHLVDFPDARDWGDEYSEILQQSVVDSIRQAQADGGAGIVDKDGVANVLAISGGGSYGAFGAGLLCGWSETGTRPKFKLVTGISTGSLIAPFAFLGEDYDHILRESYTEISTKDIYTERPLFSVLFDSRSLVDTAPLVNMIARVIDEKTLERIAVEHRKGRRLFVGTTNIDAGRLMIWDMGAIAASGKPGALELFRKILRASAAIPVAFPPVFFDVEAGGKKFEEMHVDGGAATQVFFYGFTLDLQAAAVEAGVPGDAPVRLYVIRNGTSRAPWKLVLPRLLPLATRAVSGLLSAQGVGDLYRIYAIAMRDGIDFNLAIIPETFDFTGTESFDRPEMNRLFDLGRKMIRDGTVWKKTPPGLIQDGHNSGGIGPRRRPVPSQRN